MSWQAQAEACPSLALLPSTSLSATRTQEVAFSKSGELLSIHHVGTEYTSFVDGALLAIRYIADTKGVTVGLDAAIEAAAR